MCPMALQWFLKSLEWEGVIPCHALSHNANGNVSKGLRMVKDDGQRVAGCRADVAGVYVECLTPMLAILRGWGRCWR